MTEAARTVLLVLEGTFPRHGGGGAESQVATVARCLAARGVRVVVIVPRVPGGPQALAERIENYEVVRIPYPRVRLLGGLVLLARLFWRLLAWHRRYVVIHAHIAHNMAATSAIAGRLLRKPVFVKITGVHEMQGGILDPAPGFAARLRRAALMSATRIQATSSRIGKLVVERGFAPSQVALVPNGVDTDRFARRPCAPGLRRELCGDATRVGIFVGRLSAEKGQPLLLEAWAAALAQAPGTRLLLVGEGPLREMLQESARRLGIEKQVVFAGHRDDVDRLLAVADFAILSSHGEGLSNALLEYMAAELPVVGSRVSGTEDFIEHGRNGWLFEPGDAAALAQVLAEVAQKPDEELRQMGRQARERVQSLASLEAVTARLLSLYGFDAPQPPAQLVRAA